MIKSLRLLKIDLISHGPVLKIVSHFTRPARITRGGRRCFQTYCARTVGLYVAGCPSSKKIDYALKSYIREGGALKYVTKMIMH